MISPLIHRISARKVTFCDRIDGRLAVLAVQDRKIDDCRLRVSQTDGLVVRALGEKLSHGPEEEAVELDYIYTVTR